MLHWSITTSISKVSKTFLTITLSLFKESIFTVLTLLFQDLCNWPWHAVIQILGHILTDNVCQIFFLPNRLLRIDHKFSLGLRSGEFPGHKAKMFCSQRHLFINLAYGQVPHHVEKPMIVTKLDGWKKLLSVDVLVIFFIQACVLWSLNGQKHWNLEARDPDYGHWPWEKE